MPHPTIPRLPDKPAGRARAADPAPAATDTCATPGRAGLARRNGKPNKPYPDVEAAELRKALGAAGVQLKAMILLGINCGFGNADCGRLPVAALDLDRGWVNYPAPRQARRGAVRCARRRSRRSARPWRGVRSPRTRPAQGWRSSRSTAAAGSRGT